MVGLACVCVTIDRRAHGFPPTVASLDSIVLRPQKVKKTAPAMTTTAWGEITSLARKRSRGAVVVKENGAPKALVNGGLAGGELDP